MLFPLLWPLISQALYITLHVGYRESQIPTLESHVTFQVVPPLRSPYPHNGGGFLQPYFLHGMQLPAEKQPLITAFQFQKGMVKPKFENYPKKGERNSAWYDMFSSTDTLMAVN